MRAVLKQRLFNLYFFDSCLVLTWLSIFGILLLGLVFMGIPSLQLLLPDVILPSIAMLFLIVSTVRFLQNYDTPVVTTFIITYIISYLLYYANVAKFALWSPIMPACGISVLVPPSSYVWDKIKPRPRVRRVHFRK